MRETITQGPLEVIRAINEDAEILDELIVSATDRLRNASASEESEDPELEVFNESVLELDNRSFLIGRAISAHGMALTLSAGGDDTFRSLTMPPGGEKTTVTGKYHGFAVRTVSELEGDGCTYRLAHVIQTGHEKYNDDECHVITRDSLTFVCATGCELEPVLPLDAHSLLDLEYDPLALAMEEIMLDGSFSRHEYQRLRYLGAKVNQYLINNEHESALNKQRVSYLNKLGTFVNIILRTCDFAVAPDRDSYLRNEEVYLSDGSVEISLAPEMIDLLPGYTRLPDGGILPNGPPELVAACTNYDGSSLLLPLRFVNEFVFVDERALAA